MRWFAALPLNQKLTVVALALGVGALFMSPTRGAAVRIEPNELAVMVQREVDHVTPEDLADWIIQGQGDYRLIDLRDDKSYAEYHIPGAELVPLAQLADAGLTRNEKIVLYSDGGIHSAQGWFLLRARGYKGVYILLGGLDSWRDAVVFPALAENPTPYQAERNAKLTARAAHFGGAPRVASAAPRTGASPGTTLTLAPAPMPMPKVQAPSAPAGVAPPASAKKKEGC